MPTSQKCLFKSLALLLSTYAKLSSAVNGAFVGSICELFLPIERMFRSAKFIIPISMLQTLLDEIKQCENIIISSYVIYCDFFVCFFNFLIQ